MTPELVLDHVGIVVADLDRGEQLWRRLGFQLTPRSQHFGARTAGAPVEPFGSSNHCAMLDTGYIEILGIGDASLYSRVPPLLEKYEGMHIVAFGCDDADQAFESLVARGVGVNPPASLQREVPFGVDGDELRPVKFRNINGDPEKLPEARFIVIDHLTRDTMWQPHLLSQPNGVTALSGVWICSGEHDLTVGRLAGLLGVEPEQAAPGEAMFRLASGVVDVVDADALGRRFPGVRPPRLPWVAGALFTVADLAATARLLDDNGLAHRRDGRRLVVLPDDALGVLVVFEQGVASARPA